MTLKAQEIVYPVSSLKTALYVVIFRAVDDATHLFISFEKINQEKQKNKNKNKIKPVSTIGD